MTSDISGKPSSIIFRTEGVKTASVKHKAKRSPFNCVLEKINKYKIALNVGLRSLFFRLLYGNVGSVSTHNLKPVPGKPYGIVSSSTANIQDLAAQNRFLGHNLDKVEIWPADVPRSVP